MYKNYVLIIILGVIISCVQIHHGSRFSPNSPAEINLGDYERDTIFTITPLREREAGDIYYLELFKPDPIYHNDPDKIFLRLYNSQKRLTDTLLINNVKSIRSLEKVNSSFLILELNKGSGSNTAYLYTALITVHGQKVRLPLFIRTMQRITFGSEKHHNLNPQKINVRHNYEAELKFKNDHQAIEVLEKNSYSGNTSFSNDKEAGKNWTYSTIVNYDLEEGLFFNQKINVEEIPIQLDDHYVENYSGTLFSIKLYKDDYINYLGNWYKIYLKDRKTVKLN